MPSKKFYDKILNADPEIIQNFLTRNDEGRKEWNIPIAGLGMEFGGGTPNSRFSFGAVPGLMHRLKSMAEARKQRKMEKKWSDILNGQ